MSSCTRCALQWQYQQRRQATCDGLQGQPAIESCAQPWLTPRSMSMHAPCIMQGEIGEVYNIGTQKERTVMDVAHQIAKIFKLPEVSKRTSPTQAPQLRFPPRLAVIKIVA